MLTEIAETVGIFEFLAIKVLKISKGEPKRLFILFSFLIIALSAILSNLVATVLVSSLTIVACKNLSCRHRISRLFVDLYPSNNNSWNSNFLCFN